MAKAKTIRLFLVDGESDGFQTAEIINWTGKAFVFSVDRLGDFAARQESARPGAYILAEGSDLPSAQPRLYIGQSETLAIRLGQHVKDVSKAFWERTIVLTSKDENLTSAHVRYLESRLVQLALSARRSTVQNGNSPTPPPLPESDKEDMDQFLDQALVLLPVLGFDYFRQYSQPDFQHQSNAPSTPGKGPKFILKAKGAYATAYFRTGKLIVSAGSTANIREAKSLQHTYRKQREELEHEGTFIKDGTVHFTLTKDVQFKSVSAAAAVITGTSINGRTSWTLDGSNRTFADWQAEQASKAAENFGLVSE